MHDLLADGLLAAFDRLALKLRPSADSMLEWLRVFAKPPAGVELRAADGTLFTGIAAFERNRVIVMLAVATGHAAPTPAPIPLGPSTRYGGASDPSYGSSRRLFEDDDNPDGWPPNDPYLRRR